LSSSATSLPAFAPPCVYLEVFLSQVLLILYGNLPTPQNHLIYPQHKHVGFPLTLEHGFPLGEKSRTPTSAPDIVASLFACWN
ncbi:hypothetical protein H5410_018817, partial [Solanum commersonii]